MIPEQCHLWQQENITEKDLDFNTVETFFDHSHSWRYLSQCKRCGQLYLNDSLESVDWLNGNDKICTQIIPVSSSEIQQQNFKDVSSLELLALSPRILWDYDGTMRWLGREDIMTKL